MPCRRGRLRARRRHDGRLLSFVYRRCRLKEPEYFEALSRAVADAAFCWLSRRLTDDATADLRRAIVLPIWPRR